MFIEFDNTLTPNEVVERLTTVTLTQSSYRLIPSRFPPVDIYRRVAPPSNWGAIYEVESMTNPRLKSREKLGISLQTADPSSPRFQNWNHAPFAYANPEGTTFFSPVFQCLELADCLQTALSFAISNREAFLGRTSEEPTGLDMRVLVRPVTGTFLDGSVLPMEMDVSRRWAIGEAILDAGYDGIVFSPACRPSGRFVAILNPDTLGEAKQAEHFRFVWDGKAITQIYSFSDGKAWTPEQLRGPQNCLAA